MIKSTTMLDKHIGLRLKMRRVLSGITLEQLSEKIGISFQQLQKYEKGRNRISASRLYEIAHILNVDISYFFEGFNNQMFIKETIDIKIEVKSDTSIYENDIINNLLGLEAGYQKKHILDFIKQEFDKAL